MTGAHRRVEKELSLAWRSLPAPGWREFGRGGKQHMKTLVPMYKQVAENRYRETYGLYFEDFEVDDVFEHRSGRTITETDNIWGCLLTMNSQQLHFDSANY
jgi:hypothetical protein